MKSLKRAYYESLAKQLTGHSKPSQGDIILAYLKKNRTITQKEAIDIYIYRLSARIKELRDNEINIVTLPRKFSELATYKLVD